MARKYNSNNKKSRLFIILGVIVIFLIVTTLTTIFFIRKSYNDNLKPVSASQNNQLVTIPLGSSVKEVGIILEKAGVIRAGWAFEWYVRNNDLRDDIQAGTYYLRPNQGIEEITNIITQGKVATDLVTILPGQRIDQINKALQNYGFNEDVVSKALNPSMYKNHPALVDKPEDASLEGYIYPESFQRTSQTKAEDIIKASLDEMQKQLTPELRANIVKQGLTVHEGVILASIIDQEVSNPDDKRTVAQVFLKRLREGMALQSDPTAIYGAILDGKEPSIFYESPYNTYKHSGLPPSPVSNVTGSALMAVANPSSTDYLFFVAGDDGKTYFSSSIAEHERLTSEHCKKLCTEQH
ncbi:endolytic transglycosylase MltG [Candidatus Saccharibacteria bacterium]|nr:endolytic transglycosylase MltG [Candidatus Saccharibacteria bacterium]